MRDIIFRGLTPDGRWVYGDLFHDGGKLRIGTLYSHEGSSVVREETVGQYIGLKDKDGNKIFEGDVVECVSWNEYLSDPTTGKVMEPFRRKMEVVFMDGGFKLVEHLPQPCKDNVWNMIVEGDLTVIGNIHNNLELLKQE